MADALGSWQARGGPMPHGEGAALPFRLIPISLDAARSRSMPLDPVPGPVTTPIAHARSGVDGVSAVGVDGADGVPTWQSLSGTPARDYQSG